jgi:site-specific recombinase XerD
MRKYKSKTDFASTLQAFFSEWLIAQRNLSPETVMSYRDTFRLLLCYLQMTEKKSPEKVTFADLDADVILGFLDYLESERGNLPQSRNVRLAAIHSFMRYASFRQPCSMPIFKRVLAIPTKRFEQPAVSFLTREEVKAIVDAPDQTTWNGRRDIVMFSTLYNTGARVSEIVRIRVADIRLNGSACVEILGKGRKQRSVPLWKNTARMLRKLIAKGEADLESPVFLNRDGKRLSRSGVTHRLQLAVETAAKQCPTLKGRQVSPHLFRHTTAMHLLQSGVDITVIAMWLGHETLATMHKYVEADLAMKERALSKVQNVPAKDFRFRPGDRILKFLESI